MDKDKSIYVREARAPTNAASIPGEWIEIKNGVSVDTSPPPVEEPPRYCVNCTFVQKKKEDFDFMCNNVLVAGTSLVTGDAKTMMAWLARSSGGNCGKSGKYFELKAIENPDAGGQASLPLAADAPAS
jgi:hypothetical protein